MTGADAAGVMPACLGRPDRRPIAKEFRASLTTLQWANIAFTVLTGSLVIAGGRLGDLLGRGRVLVTGTVVFALASVVAAGAPNPAVLIIGRALMGVGAALILPMTLALIPPQFPRSEQPRALGVWAAVAWGGQAAGRTRGFGDPLVLALFAAAVGQASGVPEPLAGMASGVFKMSSMLGSALGVALVAAGLVMVLWPGRAGHAIGAGPEPVRQPANDPEEVTQPTGERRW